jgi:hypothetical protein
MREGTYLRGRHYENVVVYCLLGLAHTEPAEDNRDLEGGEVG